VQFFSRQLVAAGILYAGCWDANLYAVDGLTGALIWKVAGGTPLHHFSPIVTANQEIVTLANIGSTATVLIFAVPQR